MTRWIVGLTVLIAVSVGAFIVAGNAENPRAPYLRMAEAARQECMAKGDKPASVPVSLADFCRGVGALVGLKAMRRDHPDWLDEN